MKKKIGKLLGIMLVITICFAGTTSSFAGESKDNGNSKQFVSQQSSDAKMGVFVTEDGEDTISVDLIQVDQKTRATYIVGKAKYRLKWDALHDDFEGQWSMTLKNGDKIKGVTGKMVVKKDNLGPINPILQHLYADEYYKYGTLFANAEGLATGTREYDEYYNKLHYNTKVILQWRNFKVKGVEHTYVAYDGERQGTITALSQYPN